ncbi:MAG: alpha/beta hydrolase [Chloroflexi bacterium]|nr:alpha/beta hydrolase [Chloroflexota bacterium]
MTTSVKNGYFTSTDGNKLYYKQIGDSGKTVIMLHGGPGLHMNYFAPDMEPLAENHTLLFYDQRSCGRSELVREPTQITADENVQDLEALRQHFKLDQMILFGHSWGAGLAALYAMAYPEHVQQMILVGSMPLRADPYMQTFGETLMERMDPSKKERHAQITDEMQNPDNVQLALIREYFDLMMPSYLYDPASASNMRGDISDAPLETLRHMNGVGGAVMGSLGNFDWREALSRLDIPAYVIHGVHDPIPRASAHEWAEALPDSRMLEIDECGHFSFFEQPDVFFPAVAAYLDEF